MLFHNAFGLVLKRIDNDEIRVACRAVLAYLSLVVSTVSIPNNTYCY